MQRCDLIKSEALLFDGLQSTIDQWNYFKDKKKQG